MKGLIKICGLSTAPTLQAALQAGADMIGLVHFPPSPRHITLQKGKELADMARGRAKIVLLSVDGIESELNPLITALKPDYLQLHGKESTETIRAIKQRYTLPIIKALSIGTRDDLAAIAAYESEADIILLDAKAPPESRLPGGNGRSFDWSLLTGLKTPFMLSGGLLPENVAKAIEQTRPMGVDVSSGVEKTPGQKDPAAIAAFIKAARSAFKQYEPELSQT